MEAEKKKVRVAIYWRMATDNDSKQGLEAQKEQLRRYAQQEKTLRLSAQAHHVI